MDKIKRIAYELYSSQRLRFDQLLSIMKKIIGLEEQSSKRFDLDQELIKKFSGFSGIQECKKTKDFLGTVELEEYLPSGTSLPLVGSQILKSIDVNEEYFEWISILEAVALAGPSFTFIELGAGYGRWSARAYNAAIKIGISPENIKVITVEAEPKHSEWCLKHLKINAVSEESHIHFQSALSNYVGSSDFFVKSPNLTRAESEKNWYGQALANSGWAGSLTERVNVITLSDIFSKIPKGVIDLIDSDLQGEDFRVFSHNPKLLERVKRVHIGTDSKSEEFRFMRFFQRLGWKNLFNYAGNGERDTYLGKISFVDGVQTWLNPKFFENQN
jgi:FkbM family methyltransferase